jgi:hypothetical protein
MQPFEMIRYILFSKLTCSLICLGSVTAICQRQTQLDSLLIVLEQTGNVPTEEVVTLRNKIGRLYKQRNLHQAMAFAEETVLIAEKANAPNVLTNAYALVADLANLTGDFKKGALYGDKTAKSMDGLTDSLSQAKKFIVLMNKGGWVSPLTQPEEKIAYGLQALAIYTRMKSEGGIAGACTELGNAYKNKVLYHSKGVAADDSLDCQHAREYFSRAASYNKKIKNIPQYAYCLTIQATMEKQLGLLNKAYWISKTAIQLYESEGCLLGTALPYSEVSDIMFAKRQYDSALWYINKSIDLYEQVGYKGTIDELYERRAKIFEAKHDYVNALASTRKSKEEREKKYTAETTKSIMDIEYKYENKLKEEQIRTLTADKLLAEKESSQNKIIFWSIVALLATILAGLTVYLKQRQKILKQYKVQASLDAAMTQSLESQLKHVQMQALQAQMNPHFIYNALSSIQGLILNEDKQQAISYLNDFAQLSRLTLEHSRKDTIKLKDELYFLHRYLELEVLRHQGRFDYSIEVDEAIDTDFETLAPMLIQPIIENAINHGLAPKSFKGTLSIQFKISHDEAELVCIVEDNGVGRKQAMNAKSSSHNSVSTEVNEARLKLINEQQKLKDKYRIDIVDKFDESNMPAGTKVSIFLATASIRNEVRGNS